MLATGIGAAMAADIATLERQLEEAATRRPSRWTVFRGQGAGRHSATTSRADMVYRSGEEMHFYAEPKNLMFPKRARHHKPAFAWTSR